MLIELRNNHLPWGKATREDRILHLKESISDKQLLSNGRMEFYERILAHLRKLRYPDRPNYRYMYKLVSKRFLTITTWRTLAYLEIDIKFNLKILQMVSPMIRKRYLFNEPYDWEVVLEGETQEESEKHCTSPSKSVDPINEKSKSLFGFFVEFYKH